jgi:hypothetical protein
MRGDWIHDWVRVEMDYRAGARPEPALQTPRERQPAKPWKALRSALFPHRPVEVPHP